MTFDPPRERSAAHDHEGKVLDFYGAESGSGGRPVRVALIGGFAPRKCGIATFTTDLYQQLALHRPDIAVDLHVVDNPAEQLSYPLARSVLRADVAEDYRATARRINEDAVDAVWLQHEYGIFGGDCGEMVLDLADRVAAPLIVTLHTVLAEPSEKQRAILENLLARASKVMVMSRHSRDLLERLYGVGADRVALIPHGAPDRPFGRGEAFRAEMDLAGRRVLMTFGLLGPGKGLETVIEALPAIVARHPDVLYRIVGATHPNLVAHEGEAYREGLKRLADELGVARHIAWDDRFLDTEELLDQLEACDIYLTPYPNLQQSTSGTLSYAVALGKAVVSTPYLHAVELLDEGVGRLVEPRSPAAIADAVNALLDDPHDLSALQKRAYARGRETIWPRFAAKAAALAEGVAAAEPRQPPLLAAPGFAGFLAMCDGTGMLQHAIGTVPDRRHGYCLDDNARALMLVSVADALDPEERSGLGHTFASFIQHAWNDDKQRFRNFMAYDRSWCEDVGSEDSNGRALWALGHCAARSSDAGLRRWAQDWFDRTVGPLGSLGSPRAAAFAVLGAVERIKLDPGFDPAMRLIERGGTLLHALLDAARRPDWAWFETVLGYDNPRMSEALIEAGRVCDRRDWLEAGLDSLSFIAGHQVAASGHFRPVGSESFHREFDWMPFDQQPLEAWAAVEAAAAAWRVTREDKWLDHAVCAYRWYLGSNDRMAVIGDLATGRCRDGVSPRGSNENCGAESILAFQLAHHALRGLLRGVRAPILEDALAQENRIAVSRLANP